MDADWRSQCVVRDPALCGAAVGGFHDALICGAFAVHVDIYEASWGTTSGAARTASSMRLQYKTEVDSAVRIAVEMRNSFWAVGRRAYITVTWHVSRMCWNVQGHASWRHGLFFGFGTTGLCSLVDLSTLRREPKLVSRYWTDYRHANGNSMCGTNVGHGLPCVYLMHNELIQMDASRVLSWQIPTIYMQSWELESAWALDAKETTLTSLALDEKQFLTS